MTEHCFEKKDSNPPVCGVHNVALEQSQISIDSNAPALGKITCYKCPVSQAVVHEAKQFRNAKINLTRYPISV
jgi:hypothetical protein